MYFAYCVCESCLYRWNQEYSHAGEVTCPECESDNITFENVEVLE